MFLPEFREMVRALMRKPDGRVIPLEVAVLGLVGEVNEFLEAVILEEGEHLELGDVCWYVCAIDELVPGMVFEDVEYENRTMIVEDVAHVAEMVKKAVWHDKTLDVSKLEHLLGQIVTGCANEFSTYVPQDDTLELAQRAVMAKLEKRWPRGFGVQP